MQSAAFRFGLIFLSLVIFGAGQLAIGKEVGRHRHCRIPQKAHREPPHADNSRVAEGGPSQEPRRENVVTQDQPPDVKEYKKPCDNPTRHEEDDTCSQFRSANAADDSLIVSKDALHETTRQANYAWWGLWVSGVAGAATAVAALAAAAAAIAALKANEFAKSSRRAWLKIELIPYREISFREEGGLYSQITVAVTNIGENVASDIRVFIKAFTYEGEKNQTTWEDAAAWLRGRLDARHRKERGRTLLPGDSFAFEPDLTIRPDEASCSVKPNSRSLILRVAAVVEYVTGGTPDKRLTLAYFDVCGTSDDGTSRVLIPSEGPIQKDKIRVTKGPGGFAT
jgi:hypothetical protein